MKNIAPMIGGLLVAGVLLSPAVARASSARLGLTTVDAGNLQLPDLASSLTDQPSAEDTARIRRLIKTRRTMMTLHQVLSTILIPVSGAAAVFGTVNRALIDQGQSTTPTSMGIHRALGYTTAGLYGTTGLLALFAPHPLRSDDSADPSGGFDSSAVHAALAVVHAAIFGALMLTGILDAHAPLTTTGYDIINKVHLAEGWALFAVVTISGITVTFF